MHAEGSTGYCIFNEPCAEYCLFPLEVSRILKNGRNNDLCLNLELPA